MKTTRFKLTRTIDITHPDSWTKEELKKLATINNRFGTSVDLKYFNLTDVGYNIPEESLELIEPPKPDHCPHCNAHLGDFGRKDKLFHKSDCPTLITKVPKAEDVIDTNWL